MAKPSVDVSGIIDSAASAIKLGQDASDLTSKLAEKGTGNEPDGLVANALTHLCNAVQSLGEDVRTLADAVTELQKKL